MTNVVPITSHEAPMSSTRDFRQCFDNVSEYVDPFWPDMAKAFITACKVLLMAYGAMTILQYGARMFSIH